MGRVLQTIFIALFLFCLSPMNEIICRLYAGFATHISTGKSHKSKLKEGWFIHQLMKLLVGPREIYLLCNNNFLNGGFDVYYWKRYSL